MTISSTTNRNDYVGNGAVSTYSYSYRIFANTDLSVTVRNTSDVETTLALTTDYTVTGVGSASGGTIALVNSGQAWLTAGKLTTGYALTIRRIVPLTQITDIRNQGDFYPEGHEDQFDKLVMIAQQHQDELDRAMKLPETISSSAFNPELPADISDSASASRVLLIKDTYDGWEVGPSASEIINAEASATSADASATRAEQWASKTTGIVESTDYSSKAYAIGGTGVTSTAGKGAAKEWATKTSGTVDGTDYSAKEYAQGVQNRGLAGGGSAKDWASYTGGTVDNTDYSAKKYATDAASLVNSAFYRDTVRYTSASSPVTLTSADNGKLHVFNSSGGAISVTLPSIASVTLPFNLGFLCETAGNTITVNRASTDTIQGATSKTLSVVGVGFQLVADDSTAPDKWDVMEFGVVADGSVTRAKLADGAVADVNIAAKTTTYTTTTDDDVITVSTASAWTLTLPALSGITGKRFVIKKTSSDYNALTIDGNGSETIDGSTTTSIRFQYESIELVAGASEWHIIRRTGRPVVSAVSIDNNGATATIVSQSHTAIASVTRNSAGTVQVNFTTGYFTVAPSVIPVSDNGGDRCASLVADPTTSSVTIVTNKASDGTVQDEDINIIISMLGADYKI